MTKVLSGEVAKHNITVNALCTGIIVTDQIARRYDKAKPNITFEEFVAEAGKAVPMGRMGTTEEYANMACFWHPIKRPISRAAPLTSMVAFHQCIKAPMD